jgi:MoxR-like ATPase
VRACRPGEPEGRDLADAVSWGPGPRAAQALMLTVRARALLDGRLAPSPEDVAALARPVLIAPHGAVLRRPRAGRDLGAHHRRGRGPRDPGLEAAA